ncbi:hypothetical protein ONS95_013240 [Cadophora gregata]|uniref:uncharacterized protein n=1 Tax=Cadophora gregata TaxID=51156 RepID=UPI0026DC29AF|nr:uncharacterized protein ONS95_013240 [Cadophora gregata]KAK0099937.1 hypothetical protein ONS96_007883 [Cadophora gregata f. sp. sojae]KAK0116211.1 hypothetical protein ONS95_013240 [Cadophora gregata]
MSNTPITSLPGYPYFYAIPISGYIRDGPDKRSKRFSKSRLQDRHSLPPPYTPPPAWSPYILEGLAELDGLNEIPRQIYPDHQRPFENQQIRRPQTTPPEMSQRKRSRFPSLSTKHSWTTYKPQVSSPLSLPSCAGSRQDLSTIEEQEPDRSGAGGSRLVPVAEMERQEEDMSDEERVQAALIESIFVMLHDLQPNYLPQLEKTVSQIMPRQSRKHRLSRQPSVRISPMFAS